MRKTFLAKKDLNKPLAKKDLVDAVAQVISRTKEDIEIAVAQIVTAVEKSQNNLDNKLTGRLDNLDHKVDELDHTVKDIKFDVSDIKRRMTDLEADTPSKKLFENWK